MTTILAIANQKGGVAKTTTTVSLGGALAELGREVLLVDLDPQANLTLALGTNPAGVRGSSADVLLNAASPAGVSRETGVPGLDLVPASAELEAAERFLPGRQEYELCLRRALMQEPPLERNERPRGNGRGRKTPEYVRNPVSAYDYVILDCPPVLGAVTLAAMSAAHLLIVPTQPEYFSVHALRNMMAAIRRVRAEFNPRLVYRILITMQDCRNRIHRRLSEQIQTTFADGLFRTVIQVDTQLRESAVVGLPITHYRSKSRSALQYLALAQELMEHVEEKTAEPA